MANNRKIAIFANRVLKQYVESLKNKMAYEVKQKKRYPTFQGGAASRGHREFLINKQKLLTHRIAFLFVLIKI